MKLVNRQPQAMPMADGKSLMAEQSETCSCGQYKGAGRVMVCGDCWERVPREVRHQVQFGSRMAKRIAAEVVIGFARARKQDPDAEFVALPGWRGGPRPHVRD